VGLVLGLILLGLDLALGLALPQLLADAVVIIALISLSGALHLDGLIDTCDGVLGGRSPEERLQIMRDSRVGGFGVVGAFSILLLKYVALVSISFPDKLAALLLMPVLGRWTMVYSVFAHPYVRPMGTGKVFKEGASARRMIVATLLALALSLVIIGPKGLGLIGGIGFIAWILGSFLCRKLGGLTGDTYGASNEVGEVSTLILILILAKYLPPGGLLLWLGSFW
jgi:adenosylcobinamide-GDP ribazoletransferase